MDPRYDSQGYQDERQRGEASSYYNQQSASQYPYSNNSGGQQSYGQPTNPQYGSLGAPAEDRYNDDRNQYSSYQNEDPYKNAHAEEEGDRGLMGALAGGAAGAYGGHKMGHGVIGAIGGAFAGHKLEDFVHDRKEKKEEKERLEEQLHSTSPPSGYSSNHHEGHHDRSIGNYAGNFTSTSYDIHLEGDYDLRATCKRRDGETNASTLNLNSILSNEDGHFRWARGGSGPSTVTVQQGDTLRDIARRFGCSFEEIARRNDIANPDMIYPGQTLQVPGQSVGNFSSSARDIRLVDGGRALEAELRNTSGDWHRSRIELDERIGNADGNLHFI
ncbi:carbohydrate-binding module family 50 protein [Hypoxylon rubiginosum]|uniref:Carbohydrate-binding module family 50 protein n=1 Tax=Hypoxylon rubiginosum TaxID=110542 RepID=A0ACC0DC47_9PEZI|nr:carbohydrate-binding module family 50 protein [Hypoxylon rubiginosum]